MKFLFYIRKPLLVAFIINAICAVTAIAQVSITGTGSLCAGTTTTLSSSAGGGTWSSSNTSVATVGSTGIVSGVAAGTSVISYTSGSTATLTVTVNATPGAITSSSTPLGVIQTIAGNGSASFGGDGGAATAAYLYNPMAVAIDASGNMYIADNSNARVRKVTPSGIISTFAGTGSSSYGGDGGAATAAYFNNIGEIAVDGSGNVYIADDGNHRIRKVNTSGIVTTIAGNGTAGFGSDGVAATSTSLYYPWGVAVDGSGNVYIADQNNNRIRKVNTSGIISTVAGAGASSFGGDGGAATSAYLSSPQRVAVDGSGNIYISDVGNARIRKVNSSGTISTIVGTGSNGFSGDGGAATAAQINSAQSMTVDAGGNLLLCDAGNGRIRKINTLGIISTIAGGGSSLGDGGAATAANLSYPRGIAIDANSNIYIADQTHERIRIIYGTTGNITVCSGTTTALVDGTSSGVWASSNSSVATMGTTGTLYGVAAGTSIISYSLSTGCSATTVVTVIATPSAISGTTTICSGSTSALTDAGSGTWSSSSSGVAAVGSTGVVTGVGAGTTMISFTIAGCPAIAVMTVNPSPTAIIAPGGTLGNINTIAGNGTYGFSGDGGAATSAEIAYPYGTATDANGNTYVADASNNRIRKISPSGIITTYAGTGSGGYSGDGGAATAATISGPTDVAVDAAGNLYIADNGNSRIRMVNTSGVITTVAGSSSSGFGGDGGAATSANLSSPYGVTVDNAGNIYIADFSNQRIRKVNSSGIISTVAGNGSTGYSGDGTVATAAILYYPMDVAVDASGNLYIAEYTNHLIRKVNTSGILSTVAGIYSSYYTYYGGTYGGDGGPATSAHLNYPSSVALDVLGNLYIADHSNNRVRMVGTTGTISTIAGTGSSSFSGDGGVATAAALNGPWGVALDASGNIYIADQYNQRVRAIRVISGPSTVCQGSTITLIEGAGGGTWSSSSTSVATVGSSGTVSGVSAGTTIISYAFSTGCNAAMVLTVIATPSAITGASNVCAGASTSLTDAGGGTWSSSSSGVAAVGSTGVVTGVGAGTTTISYTVAGCAATAAMTVNASPTAIIAPGGTLGNINTIAGNGSYGYSGDGGAATSASIASPYDAVADASGNIYIADFNNNRIRKISPSGVITTFAGTGSGGYSGDGGQATAAYLYNPAGVAVDATGNVYIADAGNNRIRMVNTSGVITTVAGNGGGGFGGDGGAATSAYLNYPWGITVDNAGNLYIADNYNHRIRQVNSSGIINTVAGNGSYGYGGDGGAATSAYLAYPSGVAVDAAGDLFIADRNNQRIRKVTSGIISTIAGNGSAGYGGDGVAATSTYLYYPYGVGADAAGNVYIADANNNRIRQVDASGIIHTVAGNGSGSFSGDGGAATAATVNYPLSVSVDAGGDLIIADLDNQRIRIINAISGSAAVCQGNTITLMDGVSGGTWSSSNTAVATMGTTGVVSGVSVGTTVISYAFAGGCAATTVLTVNSTPSAITGTTTVCSGSTTALTDAGSGTWSSSSSGIAAVGSTGVVTGVGAGTTTISYTVAGCAATAAMTVNASPTAIIAPGGTLGNINTIAGNGSATFAGDGGAATSASLYTPYGVAADAYGNTYIADLNNQRVRKISPTGVITTFAGTGSGSYSGDGGAATAAALNGPSDVAVDAAGNVYIADQYNNRIRMVNTAGIITTVAGSSSGGYGGDGGAATAAYLNNPWGITLDNSGNLYIADFYNQRIRMVNSSGIITTVAGTGSSGYSGDGGAATSANLYYPAGVALDAAGNMYIADRQNHLIRKVNTSGIISTFAGTWSYYATYYYGGSYSGDGGAATSAYLNYPKSVAVDASGNVYIADQNNSRIRKVDPTGIITTAAGNGSSSFSGDGGAPTAASISYPSDVSVDASGNIYIADQNNQRIRMINAISGPSSLCEGATMTLIEGISGGAWSSSSTAIATVGSTGTVAGVSAGTAIISYSFVSGCMTTKIVTVNAVPSAISGTAIVCSGSTTALTDAGGGSWSSSAAGIAAVGSTGVVTGVSAGSANITYSLAGCTAQTTVTVKATPSTISVSSGTGTISTVAGNGGGGFYGDGGAATSAYLYYPLGVAEDAAGNMYIADNSNYRVRKVSPSGVISTIAGNGSYGFSGDGGPATAATFNGIYTVVADNSGNVYISDQGNSRIRKVNSSGIITTVAGNGSYGYGSDGVAATSTSLYNPAGIALDATGNLYIADADNNRIRMVNTSGIITTVAGTYSYGFGGDGGAATSAYLYYPQSVAVDGTGNLYIADASNYRIRKVNSSGVISTIAGYGYSGFSGDGGPATAAGINYVTSITTDAAGNIYFADPNDQRVRSINPSGIINTVAGSGSYGFSGDGGAATSASLNGPYGVGTDATGNLYIADEGNQRIRKITLSSSNTSVCAGATINLLNGISGGTWSTSNALVASVGSATGVVSGVSAGTATITYDLANGCSAATTVVTVNAAPSAISGTTAVCTGYTTNLTDAGGGAWSSSNTSVASVGTGSGIVGGVAAGTAVITYTLAGCTATTITTVNAVPGTISGAPSVCAGATITLSNATSGGAWSSANTAVATAGSTGIITGVSGGTTTITYMMPTGCYVTKLDTVNTVPVMAPISGSGTVCIGTTVSLSDATPGGFWFSSNVSLATVTSSGLVTGVSGGSVVIAYAASNVCGVNAVFTSVTVNSASPIAGTTSVCTGATTSLSNSTSGGTWSSSNMSVATVDATGTVSGVSSGTTTITYSLSCGSVTTTVTVNAVPVAGSISGTSTVCETATVTLSESASGGTWSSSSTANATVSPAGVVTGVGAGTVTISYATTNGCGSAIATYDMTVQPGATAGSISGAGSVCASATTTLSETVSGGTWSSSSTGNATITSGGVVTGVSAGTTIISYTATNACGTAVTSTVMTVNPLPDAGTISGSSIVCETATITLSSTASGGSWSSSSTANATVSSTGVVTGVSAGSATISYSVASSCGSALATYEITIQPAVTAGSISGASSVCVSANTTLSESVSGGAWSSSSTANATITSGGVVTGVSAGTTIISYAVTTSCGTAIATSLMTINPLPDAGAISGSSSVCETATITLSNTATGGTWSSSSTANASVSASGVVTGVSAGTAVISYAVTNSCGASYTAMTITVNPAPDAGTISGASNVLVAGTITLSDGVSGGTWGMTNSNATISSAGVVTGAFVGMDTVTYTVTNACGSATATKTITVGSSLPSIIGDTSVCVGTMTTLSDATSGGTWASGNTSVATVISATGVVTGVSAGTAVITYTSSGAYVTAIVVVSALPDAIAGTTTLCANSTTTLSNATGGGNWSSSNVLAANVGSASGLVSGVGGGTSVISYTLPGGCFVTTTVLVNPIGPIAGNANVCIGTTVTLTDSVSGGTWSGSPTSVATVGAGTGIVTGVAAPATATITYSLATGCRATRVVSVNQVPGAIAGTATMCQGATTTLSDPTSGGTWSSANTAVATAGTAGAITGVSGGTAVITYANAAGCVATKAVTVNPEPSAILGGTTLCAGTSVTVTNLVSGGTWSSSNSAVASIGSSTGIITAVSNGTSIITYTLPCGVATTTVTVGGAPVVTSVSPDIDTMGSAVVISGANFSGTTTNNIVYFGATAATVTAATSTSLTVTVPSGAIYSPVTVENNGCALTAYAAYPFLPTYNNSAYIATTINFNSKVDYTSGTNPMCVAFGDIDGDGKPDMVCANAGAGTNTISVFRNTSTTGSITTASFAAKVDFTTGTTPYFVAIGDLDNDGKLDIVVANYGSSPATISVFRNTATSGVINSSSLATKVDYTVGAGPKALAIGDLDKDGRADIAVANYGANTISVLRNISSAGTISSGSFAAKVDFVTGSHPYGIAIGDLDGDGKPDIAVPNQGASTVSVLRNTSTIGSLTSGSFATKIDFATGSQPYGVSIADIDGDGKLDLVVPNYAASTVSVLRNIATSGSISSGSFASKVDFTTGSGPYCASIGDINGDGKADLVIANRTSNTVSVLRNTSSSGAISSSSFAAKVDLATGTAPMFVAVGDLDADGKPDIATANISANTISVLKNSPVLHPAPHGSAGEALTLCAGSAVAISESTKGGSWSSSDEQVAVVDDNGIVKGFSAGRAAVTYTTSAFTDITTIIVNAVPDAVSVKATPGTDITAGERVQLTAIVPNDGGAYQYQWQLNGAVIPGATNASYTSSKFAGNDVVSCIVGSANCNGYTVAGSVTFNVFGAINNTLLAGDANVRVTPNPNGGLFTITGTLGTQADEDVAIEVTDMLGQVVYTGKTVAKQGRLNAQVLMTSVANGMYILNLRSGSETKLFHIVIER